LEHDSVTGALEAVRDPVVLPAPSFLARPPKLPVVYAVGETEPVGSLTALAVDGLKEISRRDLAGAGPCHLVVHPAGRHVLTAEYVSGSVSVHALEADGRIGEQTDHVRLEGSGPIQDRQETAHAHQVTIDPRDGSVRVADLGSDTVHRFALDTATGRLTRLDAMPQRKGNGPRHLADHPGGRTYVVNELAATVGLWDREEAVPTGTGTGNLPSEIAVSEDGRFLYVGNRGDDTLAVFEVGDGYDLTFLGETKTGGSWPRHFILEGRYVYVANQNSGTVTILERDTETGLLQSTDNVAEVPSASSLLVL
jgi:6-phosphogluconolactonase